MENFFKCPKSQYICIFTSPINTILTTQFILSRQSDSRDSVVIGTVWADMDFFVDNSIGNNTIGPFLQKSQ